jgi:hypothetical protein
MKLDIGKIQWLIYPAREPLIALGFVRVNKGGALIIGGKTGTHFTGHGESYWKKFTEIISLGYIPVEVAQDLKILPLNWQPPQLSSSERDFILGIQQGKI